MRHERDAAVVSALRLVTLFVEYCNDRVFPLLWDFPLAPDEGGESVELQQDGPILLESEYSSTEQSSSLEDLAQANKYS